MQVITYFLYSFENDNCRANWNGRKNPGELAEKYLFTESEIPSEDENTDKPEQ